MIVQFKGLSTATPFPLVGDLLAPGPSTSVDVWSHLDFSKRNNWNVLYDQRFTLIGNGASSFHPNTTSTILSREVYVNMRKANKKIQLIGPSGQGKNRLFFVYISDSGTSSHPSMTLNFRTTYRDA